MIARVCLSILAVGSVNHALVLDLSVRQSLLYVVVANVLVAFVARCSAALREARYLHRTKRANDVVVGRAPQGILEELEELKRLRRAVD